jgi:hypothetical protein
MHAMPDSHGADVEIDEPRLAVAQIALVKHFSPKQL